jgi:hypothetical protein
MSGTSTPKSTSSSQSALRCRRNVEVQRAPKKMKFGLKSNDETSVEVPDEAKLSLRRRMKLLTYGPENQAGLSEALDYRGGDSEMLHAEARAFRCRYARAVKKVIAAGGNPKLVKRPDPLNPSYCRRLEVGENCQYCDQSDSSSGEDTDDDVDFNSFEKTCKPQNLKESDDEEFSYDHVSRDNHSFGGPPTSQDFSMACEPVYLEPLQTPRNPRSEPHRDEKVNPQMQILRLSTQVDKLNSSLEALKQENKYLISSIGVGKKRQEALQRQNASLNSSLDLARVVKVEPANTLQIDLKPLKGLDHSATAERMSEASGRNKLMKDLLGLATVGVPSSTFQLAEGYNSSGKFFTARTPPASTGDSEDSQGLRQYLFHLNPYQHAWETLMNRSSPCQPQV